jgi:hypothetical protein
MREEIEGDISTQEGERGGRGSTLDEATTFAPEGRSDHARVLVRRNSGTVLSLMEDDCPQSPGSTSANSFVSKQLSLPGGLARDSLFLPAGGPRMSRATRQLQHAVAGTVALAAATLFAPAAVRADFPLPLPHEIHAEVRAHVHDVLRSIGRIPEQIAHGHAEHLQVFFGGNSYYGPHRHQHVIYNFPVSIGNEVYYRPYTYCNDRLFGDYDFGSYSYRPQLWVGWGLDSHSRWCSHHRTYYPAAHSCFRSNHYRSSRNWARSSSYDSCDHRSRSCTHRNGYRSGSGHDRRWDRRDGRDGRGDGRAHPRQWSQQNPSYRQPVENRTWNDRRAPLQRRPQPGERSSP